MRFWNLLLTLCLLLVASHQSVTEITEASALGDSFWFVQIYDPSKCQKCQAQLKQLEKVSQLLKGVVKIGKVNRNSIPLLKKLPTKQNPAYFLVKGNLNDYVEYKEKVSRVSISKFILNSIQNIVKERNKSLFGGSGGEDKKQQKQTKSSKKQGKSSQKSKKTEEKDSSGVYIIQDSNFEETILNSEQAWFVEFYSPSCGHCRSLEPEWNKLPSLIGKKVKIAKIDATKNRNMAQKYQIKGFPTILLFPIGDKETPVSYSSERTSEAMVSWLNGQKIGQQKQQFRELSKSSYNKQCNKNIKKSELKTLDFVEQLMEEQKKKPFRFFYSKSLPNFEQELMIQDRSTPKLVSIWDSINSYKVYNGAQNKEAITEYFGKIMERRSWIRTTGKIESHIFTQSAQL